MSVINLHFYICLMRKITVRHRIDLRFNNSPLNGRIRSLGFYCFKI